MNNLILMGDALDELNYLKDESVDMILCDPPFGITQCEWDTVIQFEKMWQQCNRVLKNNAAMVFFSAQPFTSELIVSNRKQFKYDIIWEKSKATGHMNAKRRPMRAHEVICIFAKGKETYNPQKEKGHKLSVKKSVEKRPAGQYIYGAENRNTYYASTERFPRSVIKPAYKVGKSKLHQTQKPIEICEYLIKTYSKEGDTILDFTAGSGTTGVAAYNVNRNFVMIEREPAYYEVMCQRLRGLGIWYDIGD